MLHAMYYAMADDLDLRRINVLLQPVEQKICYRVVITNIGAQTALLSSAHVVEYQHGPG